MIAPLVYLTVHHAAKGPSDRIAYGFVKALRFFADTFFAKRYGHRAVVLETVAAVPGMVGATLNHLKALRRMQDDNGWIRTLMDEAENERMHLMTFIEVAQPTLFERFMVIAVQWVFYLFFFGLYLVSAKTAHRVVGYFEEEAVISYTHYLAEIDEGRSPNVAAPAIALRYWDLPAGPHGDRVDGVAWSYVSPSPAVAAIAGRIAFYDELVDVRLDGQDRPRPGSPFSDQANRPTSV